MEYKLEYEYIIVTEPHWEDVLDIGKKYYIYYDGDNTPFIFDECNEQSFDIFHFDDDFEFSN